MREQEGENALQLGNFYDLQGLVEEFWVDVYSQIRILIMCIWEQGYVAGIDLIFIDRSYFLKATLGL